jgi:hypothetical protein
LPTKELFRKKFAKNVGAVNCAVMFGKNPKFTKNVGAVIKNFLEKSSQKG